MKKIAFILIIAGYSSILMAAYPKASSHDAPCQLNLDVSETTLRHHAVDCLAEKLHKFSGHKEIRQLKANSGLSENVYELKMSTGIQSFAFDDVKNNLYVLHTDKINGQEISFISRFPANSSRQQLVIETSPSTAFIGHQGLGIEYLSNKSARFWTSVRGESNKAVRFKYENGNISDTQFYTFFSSEYFKQNETLPTVCYDQKHLVVRGRRSSRDMVARVFDLKMLAKNGPGDYSDAFLSEWKIDPSIMQEIDGALQGVQGMACDDSYIYVLAGGSKTNAKKRIHVYTFDGTLVRKREDITIGLNAALSDEGGYFYEPEGLAFYKPLGSVVPKLFMGVVSGSRNKHINRLWPISP